MLKKRLDFFLISILTLFGVLLRFWYMVAPAGRAQPITPDEAVYGIQALQILSGARPIFYAAQPYTGTFSAYLSAALFGLFGVSWFWLKLIPFLFSVAFILLTFVLAWKVFRNHTVAYTAALFAALGTPFWLNWASRAGTGYPEAAVIGNLILVLMIGIIWENSGKLWKFFVLGFLAGLGFWIQPTIIYYILPCAIFIFWRRPKIVVSLESAAAIIGAAIGGFPVIWHNLKFGGLTSRALFIGPWGIKAALYKLVTEGFPVLLGARRPFSTENFFTPLAVLIFVGYASALILLVWKRRKFFEKGISLSFKKTEPVDLFLVFIASIVLIFSLSSPFNQFVIEPRYIFAFYSAIPLLAAFLVYEASKRTFLLSGAVLLAFVANAIFGIYKAPPLSFADPYQLDNVIKVLRENKVYYINADEAAGHRIVFQTERRITAAIRTGGISERRFPEYQQAVLDAHPSQRGYVFLKDSSLLGAMEEEMKHFSPNYSKKLIDNAFIVLVPK